MCIFQLSAFVGAAGGGAAAAAAAILTYNCLQPCAESDSDGETGCASPHRRNNSAPPSPTRRKSPVWDLKEMPA
eukprot:6190025-Amphidinium_carterae.2